MKKKEYNPIGATLSDNVGTIIMIKEIFDDKRKKTKKKTPLTSNKNNIKYMRI